MNRIFLFCFAALAPFVGTAQITFSLDSLEMAPTTIDSTATAEITVSNALTLEQSVTFSGMEAPYSMAPNPLLVPAEGSATATLTFNPVSVDTFVMDLVAAGNAFGTDTLHVEGEGTLPGAVLLLDTLDFGTVSVNSNATAYLPIASNGIGSLFIDEITSDNPVVSATGGVIIASGDTAQVPIQFYSEFSGVYEVAITITTSDPFNPVFEAVCLISAISEVGGEVCGTWSAINSPYQLIDDIVVPDSCTLTIEHGVIVLGDSLDIEVFGSFFTNGTEAAPVEITVGELLSHTSAANMVLTHTEVTETNEFEFLDTDYRISRNSNIYPQDSLPFWLDFISDAGVIFENENPLFGKYSEDFSDNNGQGWTRGWSDYTGSPTSGVNFQTDGDGYYSGYDYSDDDGEFDVRRDCCYSSNWFEMEMTSPSFNVPGQSHASISFRSRADWWSDTRYMRSYVRFDGGPWELIDEYTNLSGNWTDFNLETDIPSGTQTLEFRYAYRLRYYGRYWLDDFVLTTNFYPGEDVPVTAAAAASLSTGGIQLHESTFSGDFHSVGDSIELALDNSVIVGNDSRDKDSHGLGIYANHASFIQTQSEISNHGLDGVHIEADEVVIELDSVLIAWNGQDGVECTDPNADVTVYQSIIEGNGSDGIRLTGSYSDFEADYSFIRQNGGDGIQMGYNSDLRMDNCLIAYNGGNGIVTDGAVDLNYMNVLHNGGAGIHTNQFSTVNNSIVWFNGGVPQMTTYNTYAASYTNVQGINALLTSTEFAWGDGCIGTDPVMADSLGHLDPFSPCVDGGMPWEQDAHIPYGLGSSRADMGMYGGPANAYWGGQAPPDGAVVITDLFDIPQDQGGQLGLHFTASPFDFGGLGFNVSHYSIWRDLALGSDAPTIVGEGNWEQIGEVPAQGFSQYGYTAATLVDAVPGDSTCLSSFIVIAHTTDDNIYWVSDVAAACSYDNLAPEAPELDGDVLLDETGGAAVVVSWQAPQEDDYAYTVIERTDGVSVNVVGDTLLLDADVMPGSTYDYLGYHLDMNGNPSDTAYVSVTVVSDRDEIALAPGWNLISLDRTPVDASVAAVMASLLPGNLEYVIGFDAGVQLYDPAGLPFLNSLTTLQDGFGYWVKVAYNDTLRVLGESVTPGFLPPLDAGWNLVAYTPQIAATPASYFSELVAEENLEYVTGFDGGVQVYDPNGLPFLNSLTALQNGFGYWVKTSTGNTGMPTVGSAGKGPSFDVVNGHTHLAEGAVIEVLGPQDQLVTSLLVSSGGWIMSTGLYGDDPSTLETEGLTPGTALRFRHGGQYSAEELTWHGEMRISTLDLHFTAAAVSLFPNPASEDITVTLQAAQEGDVHAAIISSDGKRVRDWNLAGAAGANAWTIHVGDLAPGFYQLQIRKVAGALETVEFLVN